LRHGYKLKSPERNADKALDGKGEAIASLSEELCRRDGEEGRFQDGGTVLGDLLNLVLPGRVVKGNNRMANRKQFSTCRYLKLG